MKEGAHPPRILTRPQRQRPPIAPPAPRDGHALMPMGLAMPRQYSTWAWSSCRVRSPAHRRGQQQHEQEEGLVGASQWVPASDSARGWTSPSPLPTDPHEVRAQVVVRLAGDGARGRSSRQPGRRERRRRAPGPHAGPQRRVCRSSPGSEKRRGAREGRGWRLDADGACQGLLVRELQALVRHEDVGLRVGDGRQQRVAMGGGKGDGEGRHKAAGGRDGGGGSRTHGRGRRRCDTPT